MLTTFRRTRKIIAEWRRHARSRHELVLLRERGHRDLAWRFNVSELDKSFLQV